MEKKGQGALEYLLLIGGAVLVAVIVITLLLNITETAGESTETTVETAACINRLTIGCPTSLADGIRTQCAETPTSAVPADCPPPPSSS